MSWSAWDCCPAMLDNPCTGLPLYEEGSLTNNGSTTTAFNTLGDHTVTTTTFAVTGTVGTVSTTSQNAIQANNNATLVARAGTASGPNGWTIQSTNQTSGNCDWILDYNTQINGDPLVAGDEVTVYMDFVDASGNIIQSNVIANYQDSSNFPQTLSGTATAPPGAVAAQVRFESNVQGSSRRVWLHDDASTNFTYHT